MIVVEGPDGAGKTTLVKETQSHFPVTIAPRVVNTEAQAMVDLKQWVEDNVRQLNQGVIFDRHRLISETCYGPVLRQGMTEPGFADLGWLSAMLQMFYAAKPTIIYCIPPKHVCVSRNAACWPTQASYDQCDAIYDNYITRAAIDLSLRRATHYDYTEGPNHLKSIMGYINREEWF